MIRKWNIFASINVLLQTILKIDFYQAAGSFWKTLACIIRHGILNFSIKTLMIYAFQMAMVSPNIQTPYFTLIIQSEVTAARHRGPMPGKEHVFNTLTIIGTMGIEYNSKCILNPYPFAFSFHI